MTGSLLSAVLIVGVGSAFNLGYSVGVVNVPQKIMEAYLAHMVHVRQNNSDCDVAPGGDDDYSSYFLDPCDRSYLEGGQEIFIFMVSIFPLGAAVGGLLSNLLVDRFGRKPVLMWNNIIALIAGILMTCVKVFASYESLIIGRFLMGLNSGFNASASILYLNEVSPISKRGAIGTVFQLVITITILLAQILGIRQVLGTIDHFEWLFFFSIPPAVLMMIGMLFLPETPRFLLSKDDDESRAEASLLWLRGVNSDVSQELRQIKTEIDELKSAPKVKLSDFWNQRVLRVPLLISFAVMLGQQLSGNNAVMFYSTRIFLGAGLKGDSAVYATLGMGVINVIMTVISMFLVDRLGRKTLLLIGTGGMIFVSVILTACLKFNDSAISQNTSIFAVIIFIIFFASGPGSIPWFIVAELFAINAKGIAQSLCLGVNFFAVFIIGVLFLPLNNLLEPYTFLVFTAINSMFWIFTFFKVPETKGKTIDEVTANFTLTTTRDTS